MIIPGIKIGRGTCTTSLYKNNIIRSLLKLFYSFWNFDNWIEHTFVDFPKAIIFIYTFILYFNKFVFFACIYFTNYNKSVKRVKF